MQFDFSCPLSSGFHARPASHLAEVANQFAVRVHHNEPAQRPGGELQRACSALSPQTSATGIAARCTSADQTSTPRMPPCSGLSKKLFLSAMCRCAGDLPPAAAAVQLRDLYRPQKWPAFSERR